MQPTLTPPQAPPAPSTAQSATDQTELSAAPGLASNAGPGAAPRTAQELAGLRRQREELTQQLVATHSRRGELSREMMSTDPGAQALLREQLSQLDFRVLMMERDMTNLDHAIATAPPAVAAEVSRPFANFHSIVPPGGFVLVGPDGPSANAVPVLLLLVLALQLFAFVGARARRARAATGVATGAGTNDPLVRESVARLARVEQAVEAIAIEVERVSEGQRFITRALGPARPTAAYADRDDH